MPQEHAEAMTTADAESTDQFDGMKRALVTEHIRRTTLLKQASEMHQLAGEEAHEVTGPA
jgi:hypothetical protein